MTWPDRHVRLTRGVVLAGALVLLAVGVERWRERDQRDPDQPASDDAVAEVAGVAQPDAPPEDASPGGRLVRAAAGDDLDTVRQLVAEGLDPSAWDARGYGALHQAAGERATRIVEFLLENGVSPDAPDRIGWTPLTWAAWGAAVPATRALLAAGADPNARFEPNYVSLLGQMMAAWHMARDGAPTAPPFLEGSV